MNICLNCSHRRSEHFYGKDCRAFEGCKCKQFVNELISSKIPIDRELELIWYQNHSDLIDNPKTILGQQRITYYDHSHTLRGIPLKFEYINPALEKYFASLEIFKAQ